MLENERRLLNENNYLKAKLAFYERSQQQRTLSIWPLDNPGETSNHAAVIDQQWQQLSLNIVRLESCFNEPESNIKIVGYLKNKNKIK